jgi:uncharacterized protein (DUF58 family)
MEFIIIALYFVPLIVAISRKHNQVVPIILLNVFLGWTFLFWVLALCWAFTSDTNIVNDTTEKQTKTGT